MALRALLLLISCFLGCTAGYVVENPDVTVKVIGSEVIISIPRNPEFVSAFFSIELNDTCALAHVFESIVDKNNRLALKQNVTRLLKNEDVVRLLGVFQTANQLIRKTYDYKIDKYGNGVKQQSKPEPTAMKLPPKAIFDSSEKCYLAEGDPEQCAGKLIFADTFDNLTNFNCVEYSRANTVDLEFGAYRNHHNNCYVKDGVLHLAATLIPPNTQTMALKNCTYTKEDKDSETKCVKYRKSHSKKLPAVYTGKLTSRGRFAFKYGRIDIRGKMPIGNWLFPYIMLVPTDTLVEHDIDRNIRMYVRGDPVLSDTCHNDIGGKMLFGSVFAKNNLTNYVSEHMTSRPLKEVGNGNDFHTYTVIKHNHTIIFKLDGVTFGTITDKVVLEDIYTRHEFYIVLGLAAGGCTNYRDNYVKIPRGDKQHFKITLSQELSKFREAGIKTWKRPSLEIDSVHVYTTHPGEE